MPGRALHQEAPHSLSLTDQGVVAVRTQWSETEASWEIEQAGRDIFQQQGEGEGLYIDGHQEVPSVPVGLT